MSVISTNYLALVSQNNLTRSQSALGTAIERLSSGMRINSAKDDAAGQAIANRFTANIRGLTQAARNANDGISITQTTEGSLNEINENLQRIREQVVQALNGSNSDSDLSSIQNEIDERLGEIDRISKETQFNGKYVLGKDGEALNIQVGANDGEQITINLKQINAEVLGLENFSVGIAGINPDNVGSAVTSVDIEKTFDVGTVGGTAPGGGAIGDTVYVDGSGGYYVEVTGGTDSGFYTVNVNASNGALTIGAQITPAPTSHTAATEIVVTTTVTVDQDTVPSGMQLVAYNGTEGDPSYLLIAGSGENITYYSAEVNEDGEVTRGKELAIVQPGTESPLDRLDKALQQVDDLRSHLGAIQNRFESTVANLNNTVNNLSAARSRIEDADYAVEVSNMTRAQILQQAGTSVLAQANQIPQTVLSLLR